MRQSGQTSNAFLKFAKERYGIMGVGLLITVAMLSILLGLFSRQVLKSATDTQTLPVQSQSINAQAQETDAKPPRLPAI